MKLTNGNYVRSPARYTWWLRQARYWRYMLRELSSLFIGVFTLVLIWGLYRLSLGETAFNGWIQGLWDHFLSLSVFTLFFSIYHSYTWFSVTPKAMPLTFSGKPINAKVIIGAHLLLWFLVSLAIGIIFIYAGSDATGGGL